MTRKVLPTFSHHFAGKENACRIEATRPASSRRLVSKWVIGSIVATLVATTIASPGLAQNVRRGQHVFRKCALCHVVDPTAKDLLAPPLHNVIGRRAATIPGFEYSEIMKVAGSKGLTWTSEALFFFLNRPEEFMAGTYMAFAGLEEQERRDVIAYLEFLTKNFQSQTRPGRPVKTDAIAPK